MTYIVRRALIRGRVQGVSYRDWACGAARALGVSGWVRNLPDGRVELLAAGPEAAVEELLSQCREGPPAARVAEVDAAPEAVGRMPDGAPLDGFRRA